MTREELLDLIQERVPQLRDEAERVLDVILSAGEKRRICRFAGRDCSLYAHDMPHAHCQVAYVLPASLGEQ